MASGSFPYGIEIDPAYCDVTIRRLHAVCGLDAVLDATGRPFAEVEAERAAAAPALVEAGLLEACPHPVALALQKNAAQR